MSRQDMNWKIVDRPGYFGGKRDELHREYDNQYGEDNWRISWVWGDLVLDRKEALQLYEDGYYEHFKSNPKLVDWIVNTFSNVYDTAPSNVQAGFSYDLQETPSNHLHDVAIRRGILRNGRWFAGERLLEVRTVSAEGWELSPCRIPFHLPHMISRNPIKYKGEVRDFKKHAPWWVARGVKDNVEEFYQQNKVLEIKA